MSKPRLKVPTTAKVGEVIVIKSLINHPMESGQRKSPDGKVIPRKIINKFECAFNGKPVFACDIEPAVSNNPYIQFNVKMTESGKFTFKWLDDDGTTYEASSDITVG